MPTPRPPAFAFAACAALAAAGMGAFGAEPAPVDYNRDIRPILSNTCFKCHGPDLKANKAGVRLDRADLATAPVTHKNGTVRTPIVPGRPEASEVWRRITSDDPGEAMPPPDALHRLTPRDRERIRRWIEEGAHYAPHWAYIPPRKVALPATRAPAAHPIDRFILAALEARDVAPVPEADRRTLLRRVSFDLTGLPPAPEEVAAFVADAAPDAWERAVDRLLASPHYGERMGVAWLDLARFADTVGFHGDQRQNIFPYREYVIDAFNRNEPFDRFTREQLAGDLLPGATVTQRVASGFNRLNMVTREGGAQPKEYLAKYAADRVRTVSTTWLGSTVGCAECHDHKYDPFLTRDFYSLSAYFADVKQWGVYADYSYTPSEGLEGYDNDFPFPPEIETTSLWLERRLEELRAEYESLLARTAGELLADPDGAAAVAGWVAAVRAHPATRNDGWAAAQPVLIAPARDTSATILPDGSILFESADASASPSADNDGVAGRAPDAPKERPRTHSVTLDVPPGPLAAVRVDVLPDERHDGMIGRGGRDRFKTKVRFAILRAGQEAPEELTVVAAFPDGPTETFENGYRLASVAREWQSSRVFARQQQSAVFLPAGPTMLRDGDRLVVTLSTRRSDRNDPGDVGRARFAMSPFGLWPRPGALGTELRAALAAATPTATENERLAAEYVKGTGAPVRAFAEAQRLLLAIADCHEGRAWSMVTEHVEPAVTRVLPRGNWQDESGAVVAPAPPAFLVPTGRSVGSTRLDLANWIVSRDNPLTARVFVNRLWRQFFGNALSAVVDDLGLQGEYPSHPELLDWLAVEFMDRGWDVKAMVRLIVTSATYRQSARIRPELLEADPQNRLLARQNPRQLEAEFVRDQALAAAGLLNPDIGGPSATPYQPEGYYAQLNFPLREYEAGTGDLQYRRGLYMHWQRTFLHPMLANFDAPSREECTAARNASNTPQQALTLLNDPTFVEAARVLAARVLTGAPHAAFADRLAAAFERVLSRPPAPRETGALEELYEDQLATYRAAPDDARRLAGVGLAPVPDGVDPAELAAWTTVTRVLLNLNETIVRY